jgi:hypothetical protein
MTQRYISHHRARLIPASRSIDPSLCAPLRGFFSQEVLEETRMIRATVPNPKFYALVGLVGIKGVLEMSSIGAITLVDVIAYPERMSGSTLFHELVHVAQYRVLGVRRFAMLYVNGFLEGGGYEGIPLEIQAFELENRFRRNPDRVFSVEEDVVQREKAGRL